MRCTVPPQHEDEAPPLVCQFNHRGTHLAVGDEVGRVDLWSFVPIRQFVKSLDLTPEVLDRLAPPDGFTESANGGFDLFDGFGSGFFFNGVKKYI